MGMIKVTECGIDGLKVIEPVCYRDSRGWFMQSYQRDEYRKAGILCDFVQDNRSFSKYGVLRGLHFQKKYGQDKLVSVPRGKVFDVAVDIREDSPTYGAWFGTILSEENQKQLFIPRGFAHGFLTLSAEAEMFYKCSEFYHPEDEAGIIWNDPSIGIVYPLEPGMSPVLSEKDQMWGKLR